MHAAAPTGWRAFSRAGQARARAGSLPTDGLPVEAVAGSFAGLLCGRMRHMFWDGLKKDGDDSGKIIFVMPQAMDHACATPQFWPHFKRCLVDVHGVKILYDSTDVEMCTQALLFRSTESALESVVVTCVYWNPAGCRWEVFFSTIPPKMRHLSGTEAGRDGAGQELLKRIQWLSVDSARTPADLPE